MNPATNQKTRSESAISAATLLVIAAIATAVFLRQFNTDTSRFGIGTEQPTESNIPDLTTLTPTGFAVLSRTECYNSDTLFEKINGKAPLYTDADFITLSTQRFKNTKDENLWIELFIYDMGTFKNAFSVYSIQKRVDADTCPLFEPCFGYRTNNALFFAKDRYYVELLGSTNSPVLFEAMTEVAKKSLPILGGPSNRPIEELDILRSWGNRLAVETIKLYLTDAFGFSKLTDVFSAQYHIGDGTLTIFLTKRASPKEATATAQNYYNFLIENGAIAKGPITKDLQAQILDFYDTTEVIFTAGQFTAGIHEADDQKLAEEAATELTKKLNQYRESQPNG